MISIAALARNHATELLEQVFRLATVLPFRLCVIIDAEALRDGAAGALETQCREWRLRPSPDTR